MVQLFSAKNVKVLINLNRYLLHASNKRTMLLAYLYYVKSTEISHYDLRVNCIIIQTVNVLLLSA